MASGPLFSRRRVLAVGAAAVCSGCSGQGLFAPQPMGGFGSVVEIGPLDVVRAEVEQGFRYRPEIRSYLVAYPAESVERALTVYDPALHDGLRVGLLALWQKCPHLGCRVPDCATSGFFECPCHSSRFSAVGEYRAGPAGRGMDAFPLVLTEGGVSVDTSRPVAGLPRNVDVTGQRPTGDHCVVS